ncbi:MAG: hypothetical protein WCD53_10300, partial [Microcoleus sp.]
YESWSPSLQENYEYSFPINVGTGLSYTSKNEKKMPRPYEYLSIKHNYIKPTEPISSKDFKTWNERLRLVVIN